MHEREKPVKKTLSGGPSLIFAMARRMLVWDDESYIGMNDSYSTQSNNAAAPVGTAPRHQKPFATKDLTLPRWHPHDGISDSNSSFRSKPPLMNSLGYAGVIRRNSRKRGQGYWRHALRTYERMIKMEKLNDSTRGISRDIVHHEAALVACAKLGLWKDALVIFNEVVSTKKHSNAANAPSNRNEVKVTDNMVFSLVSACVRGSKAGKKADLTLEERREPLDALEKVLLTIEVGQNTQSFASCIFHFVQVSY
mmetsp:Transcript_23001/g.32404  ORF Transcript_23001/g.32404 Transcript_23001/m.32404 type:complete len:252 (+) Transcript_23001:332-1087(+)